VHEQVALFGLAVGDVGGNDRLVAECEIGADVGEIDQIFVAAHERARRCIE